VVSPLAVTDNASSVRLAKLVPNEHRATLTRAVLNALEAAPDRAGRYECPIRRPEDRIRLLTGAGQPEDWVFLAMAHPRLGHRDRLLHRLRNRQPSLLPNPYWSELEIRLLSARARGRDHR
jgi:hypothetical protein